DVLLAGRFAATAGNTLAKHRQSAGHMQRPRAIDVDGVLPHVAVVGVASETHAVVASALAAEGDTAHLAARRRSVGQWAGIASPRAWADEVGDPVPAAAALDRRPGSGHDIFHVDHVPDGVQPGRVRQPAYGHDEVARLQAKLRHLAFELLLQVADQSMV